MADAAAHVSNVWVQSPEDVFVTVVSEKAVEETH
jgi:hypothetical protein